MVCVAVVLIVSFSAICVITYNQDLTNIRTHMGETLERASNRDFADIESALPDGNGLMPNGEGGSPNADSASHDADGMPLVGEGGSPNADNMPLDGEGTPFDVDGTPPDDINIQDPDGPQSPHIGGGGIAPGQLTPIVAYSVDENGTVTSLSQFSTALIDNEYLDDAIAEALASKDTFGHISDLELLFEKSVKGGVTFITFADDSAIEGWQSLALTLSGVGIVAFLGFFALSLYFSRWAMRPVERAWRLQRQFVADASHELKTPLTVILANTAILQSHPESSVESKGQWIDSTKTEAKRMQGLVNDMLDLARIDAIADRPEDRQVIDFSDMVESEVLQFESVAYERLVEIDAHIEKGLSVTGLEESLRRLASTLLDNACKYASAHSVVKVSLTKDGNQAKLAITNMGAVIDEADLPYIFDRFYRTDKARTRDLGGSGLGLAIAREAARRHGGDVTATSDPKNGTTFTLTLPL